MARRLIFKPQLLLFVVLGYPLLYVIPVFATDVGYALGNFILIPLFTVIVLLTAGQARLAFKRSDLRIYVLFLLVTALVVVNTTELRETKPLLVFLTVFIAYHLLSGMKPPAKDRVVVYLLWLYIFASLLTLPFASRYQTESRFTGFALTPTVYSVYLETILIAFWYTRHRLAWKVLAYVVVFGFVVLSGTRLNLLFIAGLPFLALAVHRWPSSKGLLLVVAVVSLNLLYPAYAWYNETTGQAVAAGRHDDASDRSFELRYSIFVTLTAEVVSRDATGLLLGTGAGSARRQVIESFDRDLLPHNDFLRMVYDFGLVTLLVFLLLLHLIAKRSVPGFLMLNLYLVAFYHNMAFSYYLLFAVVYYSALSRESASTAMAPEKVGQPARLPSPGS